MKTRITLSLIVLFCNLIVFSQTEGEYKSIGYYTHPTSPRVISINKVLTRVSDSVYATTLGDLSGGVLRLNIHKNNTVTFENSATQTGEGIIIPTVDSVNSFDPVNKKFRLHYQFTLSTGTRYIREEMTRLLQFKQNDIEYVQTSPTEVKVLNGDSCTGAVTIPPKVYFDTQEFTVANIQDKAFMNNKNITTVLLPNSIKTIGEYAFGWCGNLNSINIPDSVTNIGNFAFSTTKILSISIPKSVIAIGNQLFYQSKELAEINVDIDNSNYKSVDGVLFDKAGTELREYPNGKQDKSYNIPNGTIKVLARAFDGSNQYLEGIVIPEGVTDCGNWAFMNLVNLKRIIIPSSLASFNGEITNSAHLEEIDLSESNPYFRIVDGVLFSRNLEKLIKYPPKLNITNYEIPNSVKRIESISFHYCDALTSLTLPSSIVEIKAGTFYSCNNLISVYSNIQIPLVFGQYSPTGLSGIAKNPATLYVPSGTKNSYEVAREWKDFANIVEMTTGIKQQTEIQLSIYPNPATDFIQISGLNGITKIELHNLSGKLVDINSRYSAPNRIDIHALPKGIYILKVHNQNGVEVGKFIKE